jgi:recombination protein RecT
MRSYFGTVAVTKRLKGVKNVVANCIYEGDEFEYTFDLENGVKVITKHEQNFENINPDKIRGAYAIIVTEEGLPNYTEIMNIEQIKKAWGQGYAKGASGAHKNFTDQMAKKTVINRACKMFANTSDDSDLLIQAFNTTTENEYKRQDTETEVKQEIEEKANKKTLGFEKDNVQDVQYEEVEETDKKDVIPGQQKINTDEGPGF